MIGTFCRRRAGAPALLRRKDLKLARQVAPVLGAWPLVARRALFREDDGLDVATHGEIADHAHPAGLEQRDEFVEDKIGRCFVADLPVAEAIDVELEAF